MGEPHPKQNYDVVLLLTAETKLVSAGEQPRLIAEIVIFHPYFSSLI